MNAHKMGNISGDGILARGLHGLGAIRNPWPGPGRVGQMFFVLGRTRAYIKYFFRATAVLTRRRGGYEGIYAVGV